MQSPGHDANELVELAENSNWYPDPRGRRVDTKDVMQVLNDAKKPLSRRAIQQLAHRSERETRTRLQRLINQGKVIKRCDGPDGRVVYYQPAGQHLEWGDQ